MVLFYDLFLQLLGIIVVKMINSIRFMLGGKGIEENFTVASYCPIINTFVSKRKSKFK